jgi:hypothetical protein
LGWTARTFDIEHHRVPPQIIIRARFPVADIEAKWIEVAVSESTFSFVEHIVTLELLQAFARIERHFFLN